MDDRTEIQVALERIYTLSSGGRPREAMDLLLVKMDDAFLAGRFELVDELLSVVDVDRLSLTLQLALLAFSRPAAEHLPRRPSVVSLVEARVRKSDPERAERLLSRVR